MTGNSPPIERAGTPVSSQSSEPHDNTPAPGFRDLFAFTTWKHSPHLACGLLAALLAGALKTSLAVLLGQIFGVISGYGEGLFSASDTMSQVSFWCGILVVVGCVAWLVNFGYMFAWVSFSEAQAKSVRQQMFRGLLSKEMEWYDHQADGIATLLVRIQT
jgi:ATP-binding cassette, subfamily B (MDR/TAP), member 1